MISELLKILKKNVVYKKKLHLNEITTLTNTFECFIIVYFSNVMFIFKVTLKHYCDFILIVIIYFNMYFKLF